MPPTMAVNRQKVTVNIENATLRQLFKLIEEQTTYHFSYDNSAIDNRSDVSIKAESQPVNEVLTDALKGRDLQYNI